MWRTSTNPFIRRARGLSDPAFALALVVLSVLLVVLPRPARAFGDFGAFDPRVLLVGGSTAAAHPSAPARWAWEVIQRTSAPARMSPTTVRADETALVREPFAYLSGDTALHPFSSDEIANLRRFFALGGVLFVDDAAPTAEGGPSEFGKTARREIARVLPDSAPIALGPEHVLFRSFYLVRRAEGRVAGPKTLDAIVRGGFAQVIFSTHDVGGALARTSAGTWEQSVVPGGDAQRDRVLRLAVNVAMYVLCSNYKDDQVHAPFLMRRRARVGDGP